MVETPVSGVTASSIIGKPLARVDAVPKATGHTKYSRT